MIFNEQSNRQRRARAIRSLTYRPSMQHSSSSASSHAISLRYKKRIILVSQARLTTTCVNEGNKSKVADAKAAVKDWNEKNPNQKIIVKPNDIARRVREMRMDKVDRVIKNAPKNRARHTSARAKQRT